MIWFLKFLVAYVVFCLALSAVLVPIVWVLAKYFPRPPGIPGDDHYY